MRPNRLSGILSGVTLLGMAALSSTVALADSPAVETRTVNYVQADLSDPASTQALYRRIQRAAQIVCEQPYTREIDRLGLFKKCYDRAVETAVANIDATALTALHRSKTQHLAAS